MAFHYDIAPLYLFIIDNEKKPQRPSLHVVTHSMSRKIVMSQPVILKAHAPEKGAAPYPILGKTEV